MKLNPLWATKLPIFYTSYPTNNQNTTTAKAKKNIFRVHVFLFFKGGGEGGGAVQFLLNGCIT